MMTHLKTVNDEELTSTPTLSVNQSNTKASSEFLENIVRVIIYMHMGWCIEHRDITWHVKRLSLVAE